MVFVSDDVKTLVGFLDQKQYTKAHAQLNRMDAQMDDLSAQTCLLSGLHATPNLFRKILSHCAPKEYAGRMRVALTDKTAAWLTGTMLMLAAALNKPEHVKVLLDAGYDPNGAGVSSAGAFLDLESYMLDGVSHYGDRSGINMSMVSYTGRENWQIKGATPLAAAVACGSMQSAAVLLRRAEVWTAESGVVCRAAVSALHVFRGDPRQAVAGQIFGKTRNKPFRFETLAETCDLQVEYAADFCSCELLQTQLEQGFCDEAGARTILKMMERRALFGRSSVRARIRKLELMTHHFPELCRESWVTGLFLRELVRRYTTQSPHRRLMRKWKELCGEKGDLTWAHLELYRKEREDLRTLLKELSQGMQLVMDADSFFHFGKEAKGELMDLLTHVHLRHNQGLAGVSSLAAVLTKFGDLRYLRKAAGLGAFAGEDPKELIMHLNRADRNDLRAVVLAHGGRAPDNLPPLWKTEWREQCWRRSWEPELQTYTAWLQELADQELSREDCLARLHVMNDSRIVSDFWMPRCEIEFTLTGHSREEMVRFSAPEAAIFSAVETQPLRLMMEYMPQRLEQRYEVEFHRHGLMNLDGTPMAIAAATGRTELVRLLLDSGVDPDERGRGCLSVLRWCMSGRMPVTPVMAAIYYGEEETAKLLLEAGAVCDFSRHEFRNLLRYGNERTWETASALSRVGFESLSPEDEADLKKKLWF